MVFTQKADLFGAAASALCLVHCVATPFIFLAQACTPGHCHAGPGWWSALDYIFIVISFLAVFYAGKTTSKNWIKYALWTSWILLLVAVLNEKLGLIPISGAILYIPAMSLVVLHLYNQRFCQCADDKCCTTLEDEMV